MGRNDENRRWFSARDDDEQRAWENRDDDRRYETHQYGGRGNWHEDRNRDGSRSRDEYERRFEGGSYRGPAERGGDYHTREAWRPGENRSSRGEYGAQGGPQGQYGQSDYGQTGPYGQFGQSGPYGYGNNDFGQRGQYAGGSYGRSQFGGGGRYGSGSQQSENYERYSPYYDNRARREFGSNENWDRYPPSEYGAGSRSEGDNWNRRVSQQGIQDSSWDGRPRGFGEQLEQFGGAMAGRARRMFRSPKGYTRSDERIREDVCDQLAQSHQVDPSDVEVAVKDGEVTLSGQVPERSMKWAVEQIVDSVSGVKDIHNQLRVRRDDNTSTTSSTTQSTASTGGGTSTPTRNQAHRS